MLVLLLGLATSVQQVQTGFLDRSITVARRAYPYQVYVPADYQTTNSGLRRGRHQALVRAVVSQLRK